MSEDIKHVDRRTVDRYIARGAIADRDHEKYLKSLPDVADKAESVVTRLTGDEVTATDSQ